MQHIAYALVLIMAGALRSFAQYPLHTIRQIQEVSADSLHLLDTLQRTQPARWMAQSSPYYRNTVRVRGVCVVPAKVLNYTAFGFNLLLASGESSWGGIFVRPNLGLASPDTIPVINWGILNVEPGDTVEMTGYIDEFPVTDPISQTQLVPVLSEPLSIVGGTSMIPPDVVAHASDFYRGPFPSSGPNGIQFSTGEPMESMRVLMTNLLVTEILNPGGGTFIMSDQSGNSISLYDASKWFTTRGHRDPASTYTLPPLGSIVDTLRGYVMTTAGSAAPRGYRIAPVYPGDIKVTNMPSVPQLVNPTNYANGIPTDMTLVWQASSDAVSYHLQLATDMEFENVILNDSALTDTLLVVTGLQYFTSYYWRVNARNASLISAYSGIWSFQTGQGLVAYYPCRGNANDESGNGNNGTPLNAVLTSGRFGEPNHAYLFGGYFNPGAIRVPNSSALQFTNAATFTVWFNMTSTAGMDSSGNYSENGSQCIFSKDLDHSGITGHVDFQDTRLVRFPVSGRGVTGYDPKHVPGIQRNRFTVGCWYHLAYVITTSGFSVYLNGGLVGTVLTPITFLWTNENDFYFGKSNDQWGPLNGVLQDILIYNRTLRLSAIDSLYHEGYAKNQYPVNTSWNLVSVPLAVADARKTAVFPMAASDAFTFASGRYVVRDTLQNASGYWVKFPSAQIVGVTGTLRMWDTVAVRAGWNMIGSISDPMPVTAVQQIPPTIVSSEFYGYNGGYTTTDTLQPAKGYWVRIHVPGTLILSTAMSHVDKEALSPSSAIERAATIVVSDGLNAMQTLCVSSEPLGEMDLEYFELPPPPPAGVFDARFSTNRMLEAVTRGESKTVPIQVSGAQYPLTIRWDMKDLSMAASLVVGSKEVAMNGMGSVKVADRNTSLAVSLGGMTSIPKRFALLQNYPNPFNPTTSIKFKVPSSKVVTLKVFDVLGRDVATLVSEMKEPGVYTARWDATGVASGVYFYRLKAGDFVQTKRMVVLR